MILYICALANFVYLFTLERLTEYGISVWQCTTVQSAALSKFWDIVSIYFVMGFDDKGMLDEQSIVGGLCLV